MPKFVGCEEGHEISFVSEGANQYTRVLVRKSHTPKTSDPEPEMDVKVMKALLGMDDVTKAYFIDLPEDKATAFVAKSAADQKAEAAAEKSAADAAKAAEELAKSGQTAKEVELQKTLDRQAAELAELRKGREDDKLTADLTKRARSEFEGFPGGDDAAVELLKSYSTLPEAARVASENLMKAQITLAKASGGMLGRTADELAKMAPSATAAAAKAAEIAKARGISENAALALVYDEDPGLMMAAMAEHELAQ